MGDEIRNAPVLPETQLPCAIAAQVLLVDDLAHDNRVSVGKGGVIWCWKETACRMSRHLPSTFHGDPAECWVLYDHAASEKLEKCFQIQGSTGTCSPLSGYEVDFATMKQRKLSTGFEREVTRYDRENSNAKSRGVWCWEETPIRMPCHNKTQVVGDPKDHLIRYNTTATDILECAYQSQETQGECSNAMPGYTINFDSMTQTKITTGFRRKVYRFEESGEGYQAIEEKPENTATSRRSFFKRVFSPRSSDSPKH